MLGRKSVGIVPGICGKPGEEEWFLALGAAAARVPAEGEDFPEDDEFDGDQALGAAGHVSMDP